MTAALPAGLGLRIPRAARPAIAWNRWEVVPRTKGFHVSRESASGQKTEALLNDVGRTRVFRSRTKADMACAAANFEANCEAVKASGGLDLQRGNTLVSNAVCLVLFALALTWLGPALDGAPTTYSGYGYTSAPEPAGADASRSADQRACEAWHGPHAVALQLPDGQHRCTDKRGRRLPLRTATLTNQEQP